MQRITFVAMKQLTQVCQLILICIIVLCSIGCHDAAIKEPDVSGVKVDLQTQRFDLDIYAIDTNHIGEGLSKLKPKYPDFLDFFLDTVMGFGLHGNYNDTATGVRVAMHEYLCYKDYVHLQDTIRKCYQDTKETDAALAEGFRYFKYYFPNIQVPKIIYLNWLLSNHPTFLVDQHTYCISLDMFLGAQFPYYASVGIPDYLAPHLNKKYIPVAMFTEVYQSSHRFVPDDRPLLDLMIQRGKEQYFLHKILPHTPDSVLFGFTQLQVDWCAKSEAQLYNYFIQQNLLYNKEERVVMPYVVDGPFAKGIGAATDPGHPSPGNVGTWLGYKIVSAYMAQYPDKTLKDLLELRTDPARFLDSARYKPR